jgi:hypothetical protein
MKEVRLKFVRGGCVQILAEGPNGKGTEKFTESLAKSLGSIKERHKGHHHSHVHEKTVGGVGCVVV